MKTMLIIFSEHNVHLDIRLKQIPDFSSVCVSYLFY